MKQIIAKPSQPSDRFGDMGGPYPPKHAYEAAFPSMPGPSPILYGHGDSPAAAIADLHRKAEADSLAQVWLDQVEWPTEQ